MTDAAKQMKTVTQVTKKTVVDTKTGEVLEDNTVTKFRLPKEPPFVKMYLKDLSSLVNLPKGPENLMHELIIRLDFEGNISLNPVIRNRICEKLNISTQTLKNYLQKLKKAEFILPLGTNYFRCNPKYFAKGEWIDIMKQRKEFKNLSLKVTYDKKGNRNIETFLTSSRP